jgi:hypothetical protein
MDFDEIWYGYYATGGYPKTHFLVSHNQQYQHGRQMNL